MISNWISFNSVQDFSGDRSIHIWIYWIIWTCIIYIIYLWKMFAYYAIDRNHAQCLILVIILICYIWRRTYFSRLVGLFPFFLFMSVCMFVWHVNRLNLALSIIIWHRDPVELINGTCVSAIVSGGYSAMNWMGPLIFRYRALKIWPNRPINKENFNRTQINQWSLGIVTFHTRTMLMQNSMLQIYIPLLTYEYPISYHNTSQMCCLDTTIQ